MVRDESQRSIFFSYVSQYHVSKTLSSMNCFDTLLKNQLTKYTWVYFWILSSFPLFCMSILLATLHSFDYCSFIISLENMPLPFFFLISLALSSHLHSHINFRISFSTKKHNFGCDCVELLISLGRTDILTIVHHQVFQSMNMVYTCFWKVLITLFCGFSV